jgi:hypothetical protein
MEARGSVTFLVALLLLLVVASSSSKAFCWSSARVRRGRTISGDYAYESPKNLSTKKEKKKKMP